MYIERKARDAVAEYQPRQFDEDEHEHEHGILGLGLLQVSSLIRMSTGLSNNNFTPHTSASLAVEEYRVYVK